MTKPAADASAVLTAEDTLVLASTATPVEMELIMGWLLVFIVVAPSMAGCRGPYVAMVRRITVIGMLSPSPCPIGPFCEY